MIKFNFTLFTGEATFIVFIQINKNLIKKERINKNLIKKKKKCQNEK